MKKLVLILGFFLLVMFSSAVSESQAEDRDRGVLARGRFPSQQVEVQDGENGMRTATFRTRFVLTEHGARGSAKLTVPGGMDLFIITGGEVSADSGTTEAFFTLEMKGRVAHVRRNQPTVTEAFTATISPSAGSADCLIWEIMGSNVSVFEAHGQLDIATSPRDDTGFVVRGHFPRQRVEVATVGGSTRRESFRAALGVFDDGTARGTAILSSGSGHRILQFAEGEVVQDGRHFVLILSGTLQSVQLGRRTVTVDFTAAVSPSTDSSDCLVFEIMGGSNVFVFEAHGMLDFFSNVQASALP